MTPRTRTLITMSEVVTIIGVLKVLTTQIAHATQINRVMPMFYM